MHSMVEGWRVKARKTRPPRLWRGLPPHAVHREDRNHHPSFSMISSETS